MKREDEFEEMKNILHGLAKEISDMSEEEKLFSLKKIVRAELDGKESSFWTTISKKMLTSDKLSNKILLR